MIPNLTIIVAAYVLWRIVETLIHETGETRRGTTGHVIIITSGIVAFLAILLTATDTILRGIT
ncbi:MAG TPA: hypothetical protein VFE61_10165 [Candidatus Sulfotelmatobacter sp.]|jgi:hypothetical protein|nr:hypothetical protein [Candidatus Sulfotelmatobacter sp.]